MTSDGKYQKNRLVADLDNTLDDEDQQKINDLYAQEIHEHHYDLINDSSVKSASQSLRAMSKERET
jgi:hypothetical protein